MQRLRRKELPPTDCDATYIGFRERALNFQCKLCLNVIDFEGEVVSLHTSRNHGSTHRHYFSCLPLQVAQLWQRDRTTHDPCKFRTKGASPTNHCRCQKTRVIVLSRGIKISAVHCLVLLHVTDRRTDGQTDGQNYDSEDRTSIPASRGKNGRTFKGVKVVIRNTAGDELNIALVYEFGFM